MNGLAALRARDLADVQTSCDVVVLGSGIAGLAAALALAPRRVTLLTKTRLDHGGSSSWAQGGVAAALGQGQGLGDSPARSALKVTV